MVPPGERDTPHVLELVVRRVSSPAVHSIVCGTPTYVYIALPFRTAKLVYN
jgi:hypothetical protein